MLPPPPRVLLCIDDRPDLLRLREAGEIVKIVRTAIVT
jgi:hypothetical protein